MKRTKKLLALLLALVMAMAMNISAFAATITVDNAIEEQTYTAYKLFDVTNAGAAYAYSTDNATLKNALEGQGFSFSKASTGDIWYVTEGPKEVENLAQYISSNLNSLDLAVADTAIGTKDSGENVTATFDNLDAGYYFVTSSVGSLCVLNTATDELTISDKNEQPTVEKKVTNEDPDSAEIGDTISFQITITAQPGAENYVLHDKLSEGLTLDASSIKVYVGTIENELDSDSYEIAFQEEDGCDFEVTFEKEYLDTIKETTTIIMTYNAILNEHATVNDPATNEAYLQYGEKSDVSTTPAETKTYIYDFELTKTDGEDNPLSGAEFKLYDTETGTTPIQFVIDNNTYRVATDDEILDSGVTTTDIISVDGNGKATILGLAGKNYWLEETKAPDGYNLLAERVQVEFKDGETPASGDFADPTVVNKAGAELPSTGGMGTTVIYIAGAALVIVAGVTLVVRRRMRAE